MSNLWCYIAAHHEEIRNLTLSLAAILGLGAGVWRLRIADQQKETDRAQLMLTEQGQITERFARTVELLAHDQLEVRVGAIYALGRIAKDSPKDHWTIMETLATYVRNRSRRQLRVGEEIQFRPVGGGRVGASFRFEKPLPPHADCDDAPMRSLPPEDIRAVTAVFRNRITKNDDAGRRLDLSFADLHRIDLEGINLRNANLTAADLRQANLAGADLRGSNMDVARMEEAQLTRANLSNATMAFSQLRRAHLDESTLDGLQAFGASFNGASMQKIVSAKGATFPDCDMWRISGGLSNFTETSFQYANIKAADLHASLNLTAEQLKYATIDCNTRLPEHLMHLVPKQ